MTTVFPEYLQEYSNLVDFFEKELRDVKNNKEKGDKFAGFVQKTIKHTDLASSFPEPTINPKASHDGGVDLYCNSYTGDKYLYIQSKYRIPDKSTFNSVISEFEKFNIDNFSDKIDATTSNSSNTSLTAQQGKLNFGTTYHFAIVAMNRLDKIVRNYKKGTYPALDFFEKLVSEDRIKIIDGLAILRIYQDLYKTTYVVPPTIEIEFDSNFIVDENVYIGVVRAPYIKQIYDKFKDSIFFENVRNFQGFGGEVNQEILTTAKDQPKTMLEKNNGIVFRAKRVEHIDDSQKKLKLTSASIVNGCQTTMCLAEDVFKDAKVIVKIVEAQENRKSWEITKAANFQNQVSKLDLGIAKYARPQAIEKVAQKLGVNLRDTSAGIFELMGSISDISAAPSEIRSLFIALFSTTPTNTVDLKFDRIQTLLLDEIWLKDPDGTQTLEPVFMLHVESSKALQNEIKKQENNKSGASKNLFEVFKRFKSEKGSSYRAFIAVLSISVTLNENIYVPEKRNAKCFTDFLAKIQASLDLEKDKFYRVYQESLLTIVNDVVDSSEKDYDKILQEMYNKMRDMNFSKIFDKIIWNLQARGF